MVSNIKKGFTLAEVVIVLVVMSAVAMILTPTLISNNEQRVMLTALKKNYADLLVLQDAINLENIRHTRCARLDMTNADSFMRTISGNNCGNNGNPSGICDDDGLIPSYLKTLRGQAKIDFRNTRIPPAYINNLMCGGGQNIDLNNNGVFAILKNGVIWVLYRLDDNRAGVRVDVNGIKSPNRVGKDVFYFVIARNTSAGKWEVRPWNNVDCPAPGAPGAPGAPIDCECTNTCTTRGGDNTEAGVKSCSICAETLLNN